MYEAFYGLGERPFELTPDPRFLLFTAKHREAFSHLRYGISSRKGLTVLIGQPGTGKTTLIRTIMRELAGAGHVLVHLTNPVVSRSEFVELLASAFGLSPDAGRAKSRLLAELSAVVEERHRRDLITALIVDEAHALPEELIEEIRLLANLETDTHKLLPIVLAGQPELSTRLNEPSMQQVKQRVSLRCVLPPLDLVETAGYIAARIRVAGGSPANVFTREAVEAVFRASLGVPRATSVICDNALIAGFAANCRPVSKALVDSVCSDLDLSLPVSRDNSTAVAFEDAVVDSASEEGSIDPVSADNGRSDDGEETLESAVSDAAMFGVVGQERRSMFRGVR